MNKKKKGLIALASIVILLVLIISPNYGSVNIFDKSTSSLNDVIDRYESVCVINTYNDGVVVASGTGFLYSIESTPCIITNNHVVSIPSDGIKVSFNDCVFDVYRYPFDTPYDLAILLFNDPWNLPPVEPLNVSPLSVEQQEQPLLLFGNIDGSGVLSIRPVNIESAAANVSVDGTPRPELFLTLKQPLLPGESGGPLFDSRGNVVAIATMNLYTEEGTKVGSAIKSETLLKMMTVLNNRSPLVLHPILIRHMSTHAFTNEPSQALQM